MKCFALRFVWWPILNTEIENLVTFCGVCQQSRLNPPKAPLQQWSIPQSPWLRIHIDFAVVIVNAFTLIGLKFM